MSGLPAGREEDASDLQARMAYRKKGAANRECEEVKEGLWLEPIQQGKPFMGGQNHRNVMRKLFVKERWVQTERYGIAW